jgi:hypothetical protein
MIPLAHVEEQLKRIGCNFRFWGRAEIKELAHILLPDEVIAACTNGRYEGGFALLAVTNLRLLLVDRKPMFLMLEDLRFDMIVELDFSTRLLDATLRVITPTRALVFKAWNNQRLRAILDYTQERIAELRQPHLVRQLQPSLKQQSQAPAVGDLAMRASLSYRWSLNPYNHMPMLLRRRSYRRSY